MIIGASGHGKVAADIALKMNQWDSIEFLDDKMVGSVVMGFNVVGNTEDRIRYIPSHDFFVAIGNNVVREKIFGLLEENHATIATLIHPSAVIAYDVQIDRGTLIAPNAVIGPSTKIGKGCIINTSASVDHDNQIDDFCHISPGAHLAGEVIIGKLSWIGMGANIIQCLSITCQVVCGAGSVVIEDILTKGTYIGVPAKKIK
jgi:sugar O-acyltransferase (sialic acid O-acetyltransferase NeuD family)